MTSYSDFFFLYRDFETERSVKENAMNLGPSDLFCVLEELMGTHFHAKNLDWEKVKEIYSEVNCLLGSDGPYENYFCHPIRVTASYLNGLDREINTDDVIFGLVHNAIEIGFDKNLTLSTKVIENIRSLTIDRNRERNPHYRQSFYDSVSNYSSEMIFFKALDKLDNLFLWPDMELDKYHYDVILDEVVPRQREDRRPLAEYLEINVRKLFEYNNKKGLVK